MKKISVFFILSLLFLSAGAQIEEDYPATNGNGSLRLDILSLGIGGEVQLTETFTLEAALLMGFNLKVSSTFSEVSTLFLIVPAARTQMRYYFNREKRISKGKSIYNNSGLFTGVHIGYNYSDIYSSEEPAQIGQGMACGPIFGVQRTWKNNLQLGFSIGLGVAWNEFGGSDLSGLGHFNFSYVILPKKKKTSR